MYVIYVIYIYVICYIYYIYYIYIHIDKVFTHTKKFTKAINLCLLYHICTDRQKDRQTDGRTDGRMDGPTDRQTDTLTHTHTHSHKHIYIYIAYIIYITYNNIYIYIYIIRLGKRFIFSTLVRPFFKSMHEAFFVSFLSFYQQTFLATLFDSPSFNNTSFNVRSS